MIYRPTTKHNKKDYQNCIIKILQIDMSNIYRVATVLDIYLSFVRNIVAILFYYLSGTFVLIFELFT